MMEIVLDTSVAIKWYLPEQGTDKAAIIQDRLENSEWIVYAPDFLMLELANVLWKRRQEIGESDALDTLQDAISSGIEFVRTDHLTPVAYQIARQSGRTVYDSLYVALARERNCDLITADERLFNAIVSQEPRVKLLRNYSL